MAYCGQYTLGPWLWLHRTSRFIPSGGWPSPPTVLIAPTYGRIARLSVPGIISGWRTRVGHHAIQAYISFVK